MISADEVDALCQRWFGIRVTDVTPLTLGTFNETMRVLLADGRSIIIRVGPAGDDGIDNGAAALELIRGMKRLVPETLAIDSLGDRLVTAQTELAGTSASGLVPGFDEKQARTYYRDLGRLTRRIHEIRGRSFGSILHPGDTAWSGFVARRLIERIADYEGAELDPDPLRILLDGIPSFAPQLNAAQPRLLHGDLWSLNILVNEDATISGIVDWDTASWGDPVADWIIFRIRQRAGTVADAFWETYGELPEHSQSRTIYAAALSTSGSRLDIERRGLSIAEIPSEHWDLAPIVRAFEQLEAD